MSKMRFFALQELSNRKPLEVITPSHRMWETKEFAFLTNINR